MATASLPSLAAALSLLGRTSPLPTHFSFSPTSFPFTLLPPQAYHRHDGDSIYKANQPPKSPRTSFTDDTKDSFSFEADSQGKQQSSKWSQGGGGSLNQRKGSDSHNAKLFVGNLPWSTDEQRLEAIFCQAGTVEHVEVVHDKSTGKSRGFAFVTMGSADEAEAAVLKLDGYSLEGRYIKVSVSSTGQKGGGTSRNLGTFSPGSLIAYGTSETSELSKIFIGNLPLVVDDGSLENIFNSYGQVVEAKVIYDRLSGQSRGFGFVTLSSPSQANKAVSCLNGAELDGRPLKVNLAGERPTTKY